MRYKRGHNEETRKRILEVAAQCFREQGLASSGLAGIMTEADLTNGAFYTHFKSKDDLIREVILHGLDNRRDAFRPISGRSNLSDALRGYLSSVHRDNPGHGCQVAAYGAEVARHSRAARDALTEKIVQFIDVVAEQLPKGSREKREKTAIAIYGLMVGVLQLSRAVSDEGLSDRILEGGLSSALSLLQA